MIRTLSDCGLRVGELSRYSVRTWTTACSGSAEPAWEGRVLQGSHEKNHNRDVPVPPGLSVALREMPVRIDSSLLFPSPRGSPWRYSNWHRRVWQPTIEQAGIDPTPHEFRHSWVTHLRASGVDPADLADVAGHSVQTATTRYTHPLLADGDT
jgi:integrase